MLALHHFVLTLVKLCWHHDQRELGVCGLEVEECVLGTLDALCAHRCFKSSPLLAKVCNKHDRHRFKKTMNTLIDAQTSACRHNHSHVDKQNYLNVHMLSVLHCFLNSYVIIKYIYW